MFLRFNLVYAMIFPAKENGNHIGGHNMRKNFGAKAMCYPMPVFIIGTYNADGTPNAMNAAWGGISEETEITICVDSGHKTAENLLARRAFFFSV